MWSISCIARNNSEGIPNVTAVIYNLNLNLYHLKHISNKLAPESLYSIMLYFVSSFDCTQ